MTTPARVRAFVKKLSATTARRPVRYTMMVPQDVLLDWGITEDEIATLERYEPYGHDPKAPVLLKVWR